jgi:arylsulfatase A-like enzyme
MLPERLRQAGYHTVGITANAHLDPGFGFSQGFDDYRCIGFADAEQLHLEIRRALAANPPSDTPRFVWVHYLDPHWPYYDHEESPAAIRADIPRLQSYLFPLLERFSSAEEFYAAGIRENDHVLRHALALYDGEIYHVDQHVARLFEMLQVQTHDLVIVTADHGEQFLDHGEVGHANTLFEETVRVPLLARFPRRAFAGQTVRTPVSLVDVVPTVLDYLGLEPPAPSSGRSLLPLLRGEDFPPRPIRASLSINVPLEAVILGNLKYIQDPNDPAREWLFDLSADHGERHDLAQVDRQDASRMHQLLTESIALAADSSFETVSVELDDERTAKLRSLGYLR